MLKIDFLKTLSNALGVPQSEVKKGHETFLSILQQDLVENKETQIPDMMKIKKVHVPTRTRYNALVKREITTPAHDKLVVKFTKDFKNKVGAK